VREKKGKRGRRSSSVPKSVVHTMQSVRERGGELIVLPFASPTFEEGGKKEMKGSSWGDLSCDAALFRGGRGGKGGGGPESQINGKGKKGKGGESKSLHDENSSTRSPQKTYKREGEERKNVPTS